MFKNPILYFIKLKKRSNFIKNNKFLFFFVVTKNKNKEMNRLLLLLLLSITFIQVSSGQSPNVLSYSYDASGNRIRREPNVITVSHKNGIEDFDIYYDKEYGSELSIFVDNSSSELHFSISTLLLEEKLEILFYDSQKRLLLSHNLSERQILSIKALPQGTYSFRILSPQISTDWELNII